MGISLSKFRRHRHHRRNQPQPQQQQQQQQWLPHPIAASSSSSLETPTLQPTPPPCLPSPSPQTPSPCLAAPSPSPSTPSASLLSPSPPTPPSLPPPSPPTPPPFLPSPSPTPSPPRPSSQPSFVFAANAPFPSIPQGPYAGLPSPSVPAQLSSNYGSPMMMDGFSFPQFPPNFNRAYSGWGGYGPMPPQLPPSPPPYVDHKSARKIKNDVNVHKDTIRIDRDEKNLDSHLVSFTFDALVEGSITIFYFPKEGNNCSFTPLYPEINMPIRIPFQKGVGQKFCQRSGTGIDLGFFDLDDLSRPSPNEDVFPLVIYAESSLPSLPSMDEQLGQPLPITPSHAQITQAVLEKKNEGHFQVKVIKQILWVDGVRYELRELYGIENSDERGIDNSDTGKECVICMTEPKDTAVLPCRHMCLCSDCAKELRLQSNKCPVCRHPIQQLIEIVHKEQSQSEDSAG